MHKNKLLLDEQVRMRNCLSLAFPAGFGNRGLMEQEWLIVLLNWCISQIEYGNLFGIKEENIPYHEQNKNHRIDEPSLGWCL